MGKKSALKSSYWNEFIPKSWSFLKKKYSLAFLKDDLIAGVTVGIVALPLAMAFAIASGVPPEKGIYTTIIAGFLISLLGGSRLQIGGPTGAFVIIIYGIIQRIGYEGLVVVTLLAGILLLIGAFSKLGSLIKYIPYPLITGFTTGIAVIIFSSQVKDFLGLQISQVPVDFIPKWIAILSSLSTLHLPTLAIAASTLTLIILIKRFLPIIPWGIVAVVVATLISWGFDLPIETISSRYGEIPRTLPLPSLPHFSFTFSEIHHMIPDALTIAFLAGIESLLSAMVADGMAGTRHRSNGELMAQGIANIGSVLFGGIPATGAIARTATNIKMGAKTPLAGMIHATTVLLIVLLFAPLVSLIPIAALAAILVMVAWNMSELSHFRHLFKAPIEDIAILLTTFLLTVFVDLTVGVTVGMVLALFLFMKKMASVTEKGRLTVADKWLSEREEELPFDRRKLPPHVEIYEITGPLFFGVADTLKNILPNLEFPPKVFILRLGKVPLIDASGMNALKEFHHMCLKDGTTLYLTEACPEVKKSLKKFGLVDQIHLFPDLDSALKKAS